MKTTKKSFTHWLEVAAIGIVLGFIIQGVRAWTEPTASPPSGNVGAPINTGSQSQAKSGGLGVMGGFVTDTNTFLARLGGNVGIGTTSPGSKLDVAGKIKIGDDANLPRAGNIRWSGSDFEGYTGTEWKSLTASSGEINLAGLRKGPEGCNFEVTTSSWCRTLGCEACGGEGCESAYRGCNGACGGGSRDTKCPTIPFDENWLYSYKHSDGDCKRAGGEVVGNFCRFNASSCPSGWTKYNNWSTTQAKTCTGSNTDDCSGATSCTTSAHSWNNVKTETCSYKNCTQTDYYYCEIIDNACDGSPCPCADGCACCVYVSDYSYCGKNVPRTYYYLASATCFATITQIGCY